VAVVPYGCATVVVTSPSPLVVRVTVADCGDPADAAFFVTAELTQDSTTESIKGWASPSPVVGAWITDQAVAVPAQGQYTLTINGHPNGGAAFPTYYPVSVAGGVAVTVSHPELRFRPGSMTASSWPAVVAWSNTSANPASGYRIRVNRDGTWGSWANVAGRSYNLRVSPGHTYQLQVRGRNAQGVLGPVMSSIVYRPRGYSEASSKITYSSGWRSASDTRYWGGGARFTGMTGATASFTFTGAAAAIVAPLGPTRGSFKVHADGVYQATVKTYSSGAGFRYVVYAIAWRDAGPHEVKLKVNGTAGHPRVDLDGIMTLE
jgi:hypothetical protein